jgi:hypothetical protein
MYDQKVPNAWCPHCGFNDDIKSNVEPEVAQETSIKKNDRVIEYEDNLTEMNCKDGGWWNPITKECMGKGNGFIKRNTKKV